LRARADRRGSGSGSAASGSAATMAGGCAVRCGGGGGNNGGEASARGAFFAPPVRPQRRRLVHGDRFARLRLFGCTGGAIAAGASKNDSDWARGDGGGRGNGDAYNSTGAAMPHVASRAANGSAVAKGRPNKASSSADGSNASSPGSRNPCACHHARRARDSDNMLAPTQHFENLVKIVLARQNLPRVVGMAVNVYIMAAACFYVSAIMLSALTFLIFVTSRYSKKP